MRTSPQTPTKFSRRWAIAGGKQGNYADSNTSSLNFQYLKDCLVDKRVGVLIKRGGSLTETLTSSLGVPLGCGEHLANASSALFPVTRSVLANFGGSAFWKYQSSTWATVTKDSNTSFGNLKPTTFGQIGSNLYIAGGRPAKWGGGSTTIERVGIPAPASAITTATSGTGITATVGWQYMWTYYNPTSGVESDWSPLSASTGAVANKQVDLTIPTTAASAAGVTKKRIYRTLDGGTTFYFVTELTLATASYGDTTADASLTTVSADLGEYGLPPDSSYIMAAFNNRIWYVDAANPYQMFYSKPYIGSDPDLEYFPDTNVRRFDDPITALLVTPGRLIVFHPKAISSITGFSESDFNFQPILRGVGTLFSKGVETNGSEIIFFAEQGLVSLVGNQIVHISREIDDELQPLLNAAYNSGLYCDIEWSASLRQFVVCFSAISTAGSPWVDSSTGALATWWDSSTHNNADWQGGGGVGTNTTRVKFWGYSPELSDQSSRQWTSYQFAQVPDLNSSQAYVTCLLSPQQSSDTLEPQNDKLYIGYYDGTQGQIVSAFRRDKATDDSTNIDAKAITGRIAPGAEGRYKRARKIEFTSSYTDPTANGVTLQYLPDFEDPHLRDYSSSLVSFTGTGNVKQFNTSKLKHLHLYVRDNTSNSGNIMLQDFNIHWRELSQREAR